MIAHPRKILVPVVATGCILLRTNQGVVAASRTELAAVVFCELRTPSLEAKWNGRVRQFTANCREALVAAGCDTTAKQAAALGLLRPTAWAVLNRDRRVGPSAKIIKRILSSPNFLQQRDEKSKSISRGGSTACMDTARFQEGGFAGAEGYLFAGFDLNGLAGHWIAAHASGSVADLQNSKSSNLHPLAFLQMLGDHGD
jgi:hypothetical protein